MRAFFFRAISILLLLLASTYLALEFAGRWAEARLDDRFSTLMEGRSVEERFPPTEDNETVARLQKIGADIGISMRRQSESSGPEPSEEARARWRAVQNQFRDHQFENRRMTREALPPFPPELSSFIESNQVQLERLKHLLIEGPAPVWMTNLQEGFEMEIPNYLGLLSLQRLLLSDANLRLLRGERKLFLDSLEASWRLNEATSESPTLIGQLIALAVLRHQVPLLLRLREVPAIWRDRIADYSPLDGIRLGLRMEAWVAYHSARSDQLEILGERDLPFFADAYIRWGLYQHAELMLDFVERLPSDNLADFDPQAFFDEHMDDIPRWNIIGRLLVPNFYAAWTKAAYDELTLELTRNVWSLQEGKADLDDPNWQVETSLDQKSLEWVGEVPEVNDKAVRLEFHWQIVDPGQGESDESPL